MFRDNVSIAVRPPARPRLAPTFMLALAVAAPAVPVGAQPTGLACNACVHEVIKHHWRIQGSPRHSQDTVLQDVCADIEFPAPEFRVTADGAEVSEFELDRVINSGSTCTNELKNPKPFFIDEEREKVFSPDPKKYGAIKVTAQDELGLYFLYTHPTDLPPDGEVSRDVTIGIEFENHSGGHVIWDSMVIHVYRPPVLMTHGLWADASSFAKMERNFSSVSHNYPPELLYRANYSKDHANAKSFVENLTVVENGVAALMEQAAKKDYAVGKVDLVGHSMGGILSRLYVQGQYYGDDVRRIVTCNTPHAGSQMANWLLDEVWDPYGLACAAIGATTGSCYDGAVCDLNVYSLGVNNLLNRGTHPDGVQVHALSTVSDIVSPLQGPIPSFLSTSYIDLIKSVLPFCDLPGLFDDIFRGEENDAVVALPSQAGGLEAAKTSVFANQIHVGSTDNQAVIDRVRNLLNEPKNSSSFTDAGYSPPRLNYNTPTFCTVPLPAAAPAIPAVFFSASAPAVAAMTPFCNGGRSACCATANHAPVPLRAQAPTALSTSTLAINTPLPGATLDAGQGFSATVVGSADVATVMLLLSNHGDEVFLARLPGPVAVFSLQVPIELAGEKVLVAIGLDAAGRPVATSNSVNLNITVAATLQALSVYPPALYLDAGRTGSLEVTGGYSDGIDRDLSQLAGMAFAFAEGHATRSGSNGVTLNELLDDALTITYQGVTAPEVAIRALPPAQPRVPKVPIRRHLRRT